MSNLAIERKFSNPHDEIHKIQSDLMLNFGEDFAGLINEKAIQLAADYHESISSIILTPFIEIGNKAGALPKNISKEQYHQFLENIFQLSNPSDLIKKIDKVLHSKEVIKSYNTAIQEFEQQSAIKGLFQASKFPNAMIISMQQNALVNISKVLDSLSNYIEGLKDHQDVMRDIAEKRASKGIVKTGASIIGLGLGIPFLGLGLGAIMKAGDRTRITNSIEELLNRLDFLSGKMFDTITNMNHALHLLFLTLLGGTAVTVNEMLKRQHSCIAKTHDNYIRYDLVEDERLRFYKWVQTNVEAMEQLGAQRRFTELIPLVKKFYEEVIANPIHARAVLPNNHTALYLAHTYYFAVYQEALLEEYRNNHIDSFVKRGSELVKQIEMDIYDQTYPRFASNPAVFFILLLKEIYRNNTTRPATTLGGYVVSKILKRVKEGNTIQEDYLEQESNAGFIVFMLYELNRVNVKLTDDEKYFQRSMENALTTEDVKKLINIDKSFGYEDDVSKFIKSLIISTRAYSVGVLIRKTIKGLFLTGSLAVLIFAVYKFYDPVTEKVSGWWESITAQFEKDEVAPRVEVEQKIRIKNDIANIRDLPNYENSEVIKVATYEEQYIYTGNTMEDESGAAITWLEIIVNGKKAYVSSKIVEIME